MNLRTNVKIRVDGSSSIGLGHVVRCISLAHMLKDHFSIRFYLHNPEAEAAQIVTEAGFLLSSTATEEHFIEELSEYDIVILDGYQFEEKYEVAILSRGCRLVSIDDLHARHFNSDLIINHTPGTRAQDYKAAIYTEFALGSQHALLRPSFLNAAVRTRSITRITRAVICFGGADPKNLTLHCLKTLLTVAPDLQVTVVTGSAYGYLDTLIEYNNERVNIKSNLNENSMAEEFWTSELAIVPASGVLLEALACKCVVVSGMYVDNQRFLYEQCRNLALFADAKNFATDELTSAITLAVGMHNLNYQSIIDGRSGDRLTKILKSIERSFDLDLRPATYDDLSTTFRWATDPKVRAFSFQKKTITSEEHIDWFKKKLADPLCTLFIVSRKNEPIGSARFDVRDEEVVLSYLLDSQFHGQGMGVSLLKQALRRFSSEMKNNKIRKIAGYVLRDNIPSIRAFERLGFTRIEWDDCLKFEKTLYI